MIFDEFFEEVSDFIYGANVRSSLENIFQEVEKIRASDGTIFFFGNGASAAIASHCAIDFLKQGKVRTDTVHDPAVLTALGNDYGFESVFSKYLEMKASDNDLCVFISVSGNSENIKRGLSKAKELGMTTIGLSGQSSTNFLNCNADLTLHVPSDAYNVCEGIHMLWITSVCDALVGRIRYAVS